MRKVLYTAIAALLLTGALCAQDEDLDALDGQAVHPTRALGTVTSKSITCKGGGLTGGTCQQLTVTCPGVANVFAYIKTNTPVNPLGTVLWGTGTDGNEPLRRDLHLRKNSRAERFLTPDLRTVQILLRDSI